VRISIKLKFSLFLAVLLLLTVLLLSLFVLNGIRQNQQVEVEQYLGQQAATANVYFIQSLMAESNKAPSAYLETKGRTFAGQLELLSGLSVVLYDRGGAVLYPNTSLPLSPAIRETLAYALDNQTAYLSEGSSLFYQTPLATGTEQVGVVQFNYSLANNQAFYEQIRRLFLLAGGGVFAGSFLLAYLYFNAFARATIRLKEGVDRIRQGRFEPPPLIRRDELGELAAGIRSMSEQIQQTLHEKDLEQEKLTLAVTKLSQLDKQQKQFIGNVTHEFKTPLTSIKAYLDLVEMYPDDAQLLGTALDTIKGETGRLYEMVEKVLTLSALEKYAFELNKERLEVSAAVRSVLDGLRGKLEKFKLRLTTDLREAYVEADRDSLTLVLVNLLDNAIKYNKPQGQIHVRSELQDDRVVIEVTDTGIGIPREVAARVFEPFYTVDKNRSRESGGAGLGLALAVQYTELTGGMLTLADTGAEGTTFRVSFPIASVK
jgi:signal transduction histidine kinase